MKHIVAVEGPSGDGALQALSHFSPCPAAKGLRRQAKSSDECLAHSARIYKARFPRDDQNGVATLLNHKPRGLKAEFLYRSRGRLASFLLKGAAELTRTEICDFRQLTDGQLCLKVFFDVVDDILYTVRLRLQSQQFGMLCLPANAAMVHDQQARGRSCDIST